MKSIIYILVGFTLFVASCQTKTKKENIALKERVAQLEIENKDYRTAQKKLTASTKEYRKLLGQINKNFKEIDLSSSAVSDLSLEVKKGSDIKAEVRMRMKAVIQLIENSKLKIMAMDAQLRALRQKAGDQGDDIMQLEAELGQAIMDLMEKERQYLEMTSKLEDLYEEQKAVTEELKSILNRAFYFVGSSKELTDKGIVEKEGGFIGIGRVKVINANLPDSVFTKADKEMMDSLSIDASGVAIITQHPRGSFKIKNKGERQVIAITDKESFWSKGNYLIVQKTRYTKAP